MTDEMNYTDKELQEMASALLEADMPDSELPEAPEKPRKKASKKKDAAPAAQEKSPEE